MTQPAVLIVEDDASLREALFDTLHSDGQPVITADSGPAALDILDQQPIGLIVSDLQMEPMDGVELLVPPLPPFVVAFEFDTTQSEIRGDDFSKFVTDADLAAFETIALLLRAPGFHGFGLID